MSGIDRAIRLSAVCQFRHIELQHRLANRATDNQEANSSAAPAAADDATA
jgi:hypothetical protein